MCDKIKAILMLDSGYTYEHIAEVLILDYSSICRWYTLFEEKWTKGLLSDSFIGGMSSPTKKQQEALIEQPNTTVNLTVKEIFAFIFNKFKGDLTLKGMSNFLQRQEFRYEKPKRFPFKEYIEASLEFIDACNKLKKKKKQDCRICFMDIEHPLHNSPPATRWIMKAKDLIMHMTDNSQLIQA